MRSKTRITDYTLANNFDLFATFTFDPAKVDTLDFALVKSKMSKWLNNQRRHSPDLKYLIVAELHKVSGFMHFHALLKNFNGELVQSYQKNGLPRHKNGRNILNIGTYNWGWSTAIKIDDIDKVSSYVQKYITKDMLKISNKKRFWTSRNLIKPKVDYNVDVQELIYSRPLFIQGEYREEYYKIYKILSIHSPLSSEAVEAETSNNFQNVFDH